MGNTCSDAEKMTMPMTMPSQPPPSGAADTTDAISTTDTADDAQESPCETPAAQKLEKTWRAQCVPEQHFDAMHAEVNAIVAAAQALSTKYSVCVRLRMFGEDLLDARPPGPFRIIWVSKSTTIDHTMDDTQQAYKRSDNAARIRAKMGPAADGVFDSEADVTAHGVTVLPDRCVAMPTFHVGLDQFFEPVGHLVPVSMLRDEAV